MIYISFIPSTLVHGVSFLMCVLVLKLKKKYISDVKIRGKKKIQFHYSLLFKLKVITAAVNSNMLKLCFNHY
jgi:hypothetical protein